MQFKRINPKKLLCFAVCCFAVLFLISADRVLHKIMVKDKLVLVEIAQTPQQRIKGLQGRMSLDKDQGMLFIFEKEGHPRFWMKDTLIPLDIAFIDSENIIVDIQSMQPKRDDVFYLPAKKAISALEMNLGWFEDNGISVGDKIKFSKE